MKAWKNSLNGRNAVDKLHTVLLICKVLHHMKTDGWVFAFETQNSYDTQNKKYILPSAPFQTLGMEGVSIAWCLVS